MQGHVKVSPRFLSRPGRSIAEGLQMAMSYMAICVHVVEEGMTHIYELPFAMKIAG
jgi:hypothetical protein